MSTKQQEIERHVNAISAGLNALADIMKHPDSIYFGGVRAALEKLERALDHKTTIDSSFAFIAARDDAGRHVGSSRPQDYLTARLGITEGEAMSRLRNGEELFKRLREPEDVDKQKVAQAAEAAAGEGKSAEDVAARKEALLRAEEERVAREKAEYAAEQARRAKLLNSAPVPAVMLNMIELELKHLNKFALPGPQSLREQATELARKHSLNYVKAWLRRAVHDANRSTIDAAGKRDPYAATRKRWFSMSKPDSDGGVFVRGYLDPVTAAMLKAALAPARNKGSKDLLPEQDSRTYEQRMVDQLGAIVKDYEHDKTNARHGLGSVVITMTTHELEQLTADSRLSTSTGVDLKPLDVLRLGAARHDYVCVVDEQGLPLELGRTQRTASMWQKLALAASELVCTHPDCDRPWSDCDVHHLQAWSADGDTDLKNLTLLCRKHHVDNNDHRNGRRNMGHAERCPATGRVGFKSAGSSKLQFNDHPAAQSAAGRRARERSVHRPPESVSGSPGSVSGSPASVSSSRGPALLSSAKEKSVSGTQAMGTATETSQTPPRHFASEQHHVPEQHAVTMPDSFMKPDSVTEPDSVSECESAPESDASGEQFALSI